MAKWARMQDGAIAEVVEINPAGRYHPSMEWWPYTTLADKKAALQSAIRAKRYVVETKGIVRNGSMIGTSEASQSKAAGAVALINEDPTVEQIDWEAQPGVWIEIEAATVKAIAVAIGRHVQACFTRCRALHAEIAAAGTHAALDAIDIDFGWPD